MFPQCPTPITSENFSEVWQFTDRIRRKAKKKCTASKAAFFFTDFVFGLLVLVCSTGLMYDHTLGRYHRFLAKVPYLVPIWQKTGALILPEQTWEVRAAVFALAVTATCIVLFCVLFLLFSLLYHPFKKKLPTGTPKENAQKLLAMASDARHFFNRSGNSSFLVWSVVFLCACVLIFVLYSSTLHSNQTLINFFSAPVMKLLEPRLTDGVDIARMKLDLFHSLQYAFWPAILILYLVLNSVYILCVRFVYRYPVPYSFVAQIEYYSVFADEDTSGLTPEEAVQRRQEQAAEKREKALELEGYGAYGKAKSLFLEAAHGGDVCAMEHYARHCLIQHIKDPARYWLEQCVATGQASEEAVKMLKRMKWHRRAKVSYLH